jgi:hypothetical protein
MVKLELQFRSGREQTCVKVQQMGVKVGVYRAGTGSFGKNHCQLMVIKHGINNEKIFNVAPCMLPHLLYNPTHALFTL